MGMQLNTAQWKSKSREMVSCENANGIHNFATTVNNPHTQLELIAQDERRGTGGAGTTGGAAGCRSAGHRGRQRGGA